MAGAVSSCAEYERLMTEAARHNASGNYHRADKVLRQAIALDPGVPKAYYNLGAILSNAKRNPEAVQCFLQAAARSMVGCTESWPGSWADSIANAFNKLQMEDCNEVPKPEWWSDEALKTLSKAVVCAVTHSKECPLQGPLQQAHLMRATVLAAGFDGDGDLAWESGPRSAAELKEAAHHYEQFFAQLVSPGIKAACEEKVADLRRQAAAMEGQGRRLLAAAAKAKAEAKAKAVMMAEAKAESKAAADALLAEEEAEKAAAAALAQAGVSAAAQAAARQAQADAAAQAPAANPTPNPN